MVNASVEHFHNTIAKGQGLIGGERNFISGLSYNNDGKDKCLDYFSCIKEDDTKLDPIAIDGYETRELFSLNWI
jgi:hypothetical protein